MEHYLNGWKNYFKFSGRTGRKEFWYFFLINFVISNILSAIAKSSDGFVFAGITALFSLASIIPTIAIFVRRMNDIGKEWWYIFIPFYNLYLAAQKGEENPNIHGATVE